MDRYVVTEELLAAGAPVAAHWVADRQIGPSLLRYGSEVQRQRFLPGIVRGEMYFSIGMSEPDSGSDLASVRTRAERVDGGWLLNGTKIWTSGAHHAHAFFVLARSAAVEGDRRAGLSQFIVPLEAAGIGIRPIRLRGCGRGATSTAARPTGRSGWAHAPASSARRDRGRRSPRHDAVHTRRPAHHRDPRRPGSPRRSSGLVRRARGVER